MIAPNGRATRYCADGELALLQGAQAAGTLAVLPSSVIPSLPALRAHTPDQPVWQQLYMARDRAAMREVLAIVREAMARAIVLKIGRASCRARVCPYVSLTVVAVSLKKIKQIHKCREPTQPDAEHTRHKINLDTT